MKLICKTAYFKQLENGKEYIAEDQRTQELCKVQHELVAIRINGILQWFGKENFSEI